jgi:hypothetical protein
MFPVSIRKCGRRFVWMLLAIGCFAAVALAQDIGNCTSHDPSTRPDCPDAIVFFQKLQAAVKAGDKAQLASMVNFPLRTSQHGQRVRIRNWQQFLQAYSQVFTPQVICAVEAAKPSDVWGNYQGFMVGQGVIWWDQIIPVSVKNPQPDSGKYPFKIIAVNNQDVSVPGCTKDKP